MRRKIIPYNPKLKTLAKTLRNNMTKAEILLWQQLKQKQILGFDFDRQRPIGNYIVDFYCKDLQLAIEVDGPSHHEENLKDDIKRQRELESLGVHFLRFSNEEVLNNICDVVNEIEDWINGRPTPNPSKEGRPTPNPSWEGNPPLNPFKK